MMEFAKYHNATNFVKEMVSNKEILGYPYDGKDNFDYEGIYVCLDTNDVWICRILNGYDENYEKSDGYLVERNKFDIFTVADKLEELYEIPIPTFSSNSFVNVRKIKSYIDNFSAENIIKAVILLDDEDGLSNWDVCEAYTLEEAIDIIDGGFGILEEWEEI